ncbi:MAG: arsenate reductase family protein [Gemmatimonadales bacterium]
MNVQIFGTKKNSDTRKALRFFSERGVKAHFVDLRQRAASPGELKRFAQKFGARDLVDAESARYKDRGLHAAHLTDSALVDKLASDPLLLRMPLVRNGSELTIGPAEEVWRSWF